MAFVFLASFGELNKLLTQENYTANETRLRIAPCSPAVDHQKFYLWLLLPGTTLSILLAFTQRRKEIFNSCLDGRPGLLIPHNTLSRSNRFSYAAAFGAITYLCSSVIFESKYAFNYTGPPYLKVFVALASMLIYGVGYFPLFASLAVDSAVGYFIGTLYAWVLSSVTYYNTFYCPGISAMEYFMLFIRGVPELLCLLYLCISLPPRFLRSMKRRHYFEYIMDHMKPKDLYDAIDKSYNGIHVRALLVRRPPPRRKPDSVKEKLFSVIGSLPGKLIYKPVSGFRYSSRILSVMTVALILLYRITVEALMYLIPGFQYLEIIFESANDQLEIQLLGQTVEDLGLHHGAQTTINVLLYLLNVLRGCLLTSICVAFVVGVVMILHTLASYRKNLLGLYKGNPLHLTPKEERSNESLLVGSMRFAGYQVAFIAWGFVIQVLLLFVICLLIATVVTLFKWNIEGWLMDKVHQVWPVLVTTLVVNLAQIVLAKFLYLQENEQGNVLAINNRRSFFILVYFMYFYNIFTGLVTCSWRIGKSIVLGALLLPRLDHSTLPRKFQWLDQGFDAYCGLMHVENAHTNPVAIVFINILQASVYHKRKKLTNLNISLNAIEKSGVEFRENHTKHKDSSKAEFRWHLIYTLLNNPSFILLRKSNLRLTRKADLFYTNDEGKVNMIKYEDVNTYL